MTLLARGLSYMKDTAFSFFHLGRRGNNSNLACLSPEEMPMPNMGSLS